MTAGGDGSLSLWRHNSDKNSDDEDSEMVTAGAKKRVSPLQILLDITRNSHAYAGVLDSFIILLGRQILKVESNFQSQNF